METAIIEDIAKDYYVQTDDKERCAVVFVNDGKYRAVEVPNTHEEPTKHYRVLQSDTLAVAQEGDRLVAVLHTHPRLRGHRHLNQTSGFSAEEPSMDDVWLLPDGLLGILVHPPTKTWVLYDNKIGVLNFKEKKNK